MKETILKLWNGNAWIETLLKTSARAVEYDGGQSIFDILEPLRRRLPDVPTKDDDFATVGYVKSYTPQVDLDDYVKKSGDTMSGALTVALAGMKDTSLTGPGLLAATTGGSQTLYADGYIRYKSPSSKEIYLSLPTTDNGILATETSARQIAKEELSKYEFIVIVPTLPAGGLPNRIYLVPKTNGTTIDAFDAYLWVNKGTEDVPAWAWEYEGAMAGSVDTTNLVTKTDYATTTTAGIVMVGEGLSMSTTSHKLNLVAATEAQITGGTGSLRPITVSNHKFAVKNALTTQASNAFTEDEKASACDLIGAVPKITPDVTYHRAVVRMNTGEYRGYALANISARAYAGNIAMHTDDQYITVEPPASVPTKTPTVDYAAANKKYVDDGFVAKVTETTNRAQVYAKAADGTQGMIEVSNLVAATGAIVQRAGWDILVPDTPGYATSAVNRNYVTNNFMPKPDSLSNCLIGWVNGTGIQIKHYTNTIPYNGRFCTPGSANDGQDAPAGDGYYVQKDPINPYHLANKKYVDEAVANAGGGGGGTQLYEHYYIVGNPNLDIGDPYKYIHIRLVATFSTKAMSISELAEALNGYKGIVLTKRAEQSDRDYQFENIDLANMILSASSNTNNDLFIYTQDWIGDIMNMSSDMATLYSATCNPL